MADFVMVMMGSASSGDWDAYIVRLVASGNFRGGSSLGNGIAAVKGANDSACSIAGFIRLSAENLADARGLLAGNPLYEAGGRIELLEEIPD